MDHPSLAERPVEPVPSDYAAIEALNWSTLALMATSAKLLRWRVDHPREDTEALRLGRLVHCATLEPERFAASYAPRPELPDGRTKEGKAAKAAWLASIGAAVPVDADDHAIAERCARAVHAHPSASALLHGGVVERPIVWTDATTGVRCKARPDFLGPTSLVDLKSTSRQTLHEMRRDCASYLYHGQLAYYLDGAITARAVTPDADAYVVAVQTVEPFDVVPFRMAMEDIERGRRLVRRLLDRYAACVAANWWPGLAPEVIPMSLPSWAAGGDDEEGGDW
jgi:exodeoxyribonuclease VIII